VRPTAWTGSVAAVAAVLGLVGLYLDAPPAAGAGAGLAGLLASMAVLFLVRTLRVADGIAVERTVERSLVRQGSPVGVETRVVLPASPGLEVSLADLPPASALHDPAGARISGGSAAYRVRLPLPGEVAFRGLRLTTADRFFTTGLDLTAPAFAGPSVTVLPAGQVHGEDLPGTGAGEMEREKRALLRGQGIRSYREFRSGDDPALIDWKLSAKYGRFFVREPTGSAGGPPFVVVDLPPCGAPGADALLSAAGDTVESVIRDHGSVSLLTVAGGDLVAFRPGEADLPALVRLLSPRDEDPAAPLFRVRDPVWLRRRMGAADRGATGPSHRLAAALRATLATPSRSPFEEEIERCLGSVEPGSVVVFTSGVGELSHLVLIGAAVRRTGRELRFRLPGAARATVAGLAPYARVEAI